MRLHAETHYATQNFLGVFQGAQIKSGPKAATDLNAALSARPCTEIDTPQK